MAIASVDDCLGELKADLDRFARATGLAAWIESLEGDVLAGAKIEGPANRRPLEVSGAVMGTVGVSAAVPEDQLARLAEYLREQLVKTIEYETMVTDFVQTTAWQWKEINFLLDVSQNLELSLSEIEACEAVLQRAVRLLGVARASLFLRDAEGRLAMVVAHGLDPEVRGAARIEPGEGISGWVFTNGIPLLVETEADLPPGVSLRPGTGQDAEASFLSVPLMSAPLNGRDGVLGVINMCGKRGGGVFTSEDLKLLQTAASQAAVAVRNTQLIAQVKDAEKLKREMEMAAAIQARLLPQTNPRLSGLEVAGWYRPATMVGGDYYDFVSAGADGLYYLIADISGHGLASALFMSNARSANRALLGAAPGPAALAEALNERMCEDSGDSGMFLTAILGHYDARRHTTVFSNCGHTQPIIVGANGDVAMPNGGAPPIGMLPVLGAEEMRADLAPGDLLFLYTDGLIEARNGRHEMFGLERVVSVLRERRHEPLGSIAGALYEAVRDFSGGADLEDDLTMVLLRRLHDDESTRRSVRA